MSITRYQVLANVQRSAGLYTTPSIAVPAGTMRIGFAIDRNNLQDLGDQEVLQVTVQYSVDGGNTWADAGGFGTKAGAKYDKLGNLATESSVSIRLPRSILEAATPLRARAVIRLYGIFQGSASVLFDDAPVPPRPITEHYSVTYDNDAENSGTNVSSLTIASFTVGNNSNRALLVGCTGWDASTSDSAISSISWNGSTSGWSSVITELGPDTCTNRSSIWKLIAPTVATASVVVTFGGTVSLVGANVLSAYNVHQTTPLGTPVSAEGTTGAPTVTVSDVGSDDMVYDACHIYFGAGFTGPSAGADQTARAILSLDSNSRTCVSTQLGSAGGVMSWTCTGQEEWVTCAVALKPSSGGQTHEAAVGFAASSSFSDSVLADLVRSLSLPAQASQAEQGLADMLNAVVLAAQGGHSSVAAADRQGAISLQGSGIMSDDAARDFPVAGTLSAQAAFSASEIAGLFAALQFSGIASLSPAGQLVADVAAILSSQASFLSNWGGSIFDVAVSLPAGAGISPAAQRDRLASLSYSALCSIQQALERYVSAALGLSSIADLTAQQVTDLGAQVQIGAQADIDALAQQVAEALVQAGANAQFAAAAAGAFDKAMQLSIAALFASLGSTEELFERLLSMPAMLFGADVRPGLLAGADARPFELEGSDDRPATLPGGGDA